MLMDVIELYEAFECIGAECPNTCCKGWGIAVDEETYQNYKKEQGLLGWKVRALNYSNQDQIHMIRKIGGKCPFHTKDKLCYFQKNNRMELMPEVCRTYPRRTVAYEERVEITLELSCIRAAELFVRNPRRLQFVKMEENIPVNWEIDYVDPAFYDWMKLQREKLLDYLWISTGDGLEFPQKVNDIYAYIYAANQWLARNQFEKIEELHLPLREEECLETEIKQICGTRDSFAFFPVPFLNQMIYSQIMRERAGKVNPTLDRLLKLYDNYFGKIQEAEADSFYQKGIEAMLEQYSKLSDMFRAYISYLLQQTFCLACEDYYLLKPVLLSIFVLEFVMLFFLLEFMDKTELTKQKQAEIIVCTERALRHSAPLNEKIMTLIRNRFYR